MLQRGPERETWVCEVRYAVCRSDPVLQRGHRLSGAEQPQQQQQQQCAVDTQRVRSSSPPSDGPGHVTSALVRDGSIRSLVNCYENRLEKVDPHLCTRPLVVHLCV